MLTAGNVSDVAAAPALLERASRMRYLLGDKGYDADRLRRSLRETGTTPVIPGRQNRKRTIRYDKQRYRQRHLIENAFCRLKDFRRIATRYDKLAANFLSDVALATAVAFWLGMRLDPSLSCCGFGHNGKRMVPLATLQGCQWIDSQAHEARALAGICGCRASSCRKPAVSAAADRGGGRVNRGGRDCGGD
jgi:transposase